MDPASTGLGAELRLAREARGSTLADVAASTRISGWALAAIEREQFERLPGGIYSRGFVRAYADAVGLDGPAMGAALYDGLRSTAAAAR